MSVPGTVFVDLDGTMAEYAGWKGHEHVGPVLPGVKDTIDTLRGRGHKVLVWTTRTDRTPVVAWLAANNITVDGFYEAVKPIDLDLIIDDRAFRAANRGLNAAEIVEALKPEWKKVKSTV